MATKPSSRKRSANGASPPALIAAMPWAITTAGCGPSPSGRYSQASRSSPEAVGTRTVVREGAAALSLWLFILVVAGCETGNWKVHRFGGAHRIEILAQKYNLAVGGTQEDYVILSIDAPGRFDDPFRFDLRDCACRIIKGMYREVEEAESANRTSKPGNVTHDLLSPG